MMRLKNWLIGSALLTGLLLAGRPLMQSGAAAETPKFKALRHADMPGGMMELHDKKGDVVGQCALKHTDVDATISGFVARVKVRQEFLNTAKVPVEAVYTFPLPDDAAVDDMTMVVGGRRIVGTIKKREEARQTYEQAKAQGKTASLLDQERSNIFTQAVANLMPGQAVSVEISFAHLLNYEEGKYEWSFPTVVGPRYTTSGGYLAPGKRGAPGSRGSGNTPDADKITPPITPPDTRAGHDLSLHVHLNAAIPLGEVTSALHPIEVSRTSATGAEITLADRNTLPNKDFVLRFSVAGNELQTGVLASPPDAAHKVPGHFAVVVQPPVTAQDRKVVPKEIVFVIDQTGSQSGLPIAKAKDAMRFLVRNMNPGDTFDLLGFNTDVYPCFDGPVHNTPANVAKALDFLKPIEGEGGTDILGAVRYALALKGDPSRQRVVCYLTDGYIGNEAEVLAYIRQHRAQAKMFPFGVGNSVNRMLIDGMAKEGGGTPEYLLLNSSAEVAARRFYRRINAPLLTDVHASWEDLKVSDTLPETMPDVFVAGRPLIIKGRYAAGGQGKLTLRGVMNGQSWEQTIPVTLPAIGTGESLQQTALPAIWARDKIGELERVSYEGGEDGIVSAITQTALQYHVMSQYTSFVAVEERIVNPGGYNAKSDVPVEMADGVNYKGIFNESATGGASKTASAPYRVAQNRSFAGRAGDPLISVDAPQDARQVIALLPGGDIKELVWNAASKLWEARFDIPTWTPEGDYKVTVIIARRNGTRQLLKLSYRVDLSAPQGSSMARLITGAHGEPLLRLDVEPSADTARITALLPDGSRITMKPDAQGAFSALVPWPGTQSLQRVTYILIDRAHNRASVTVDISDLATKRPPTVPLGVQPSVGTSAPVATPSLP